MKYTKKYIQSVLRTMDRTKIFRLYNQMYGGDIDRADLMLFIKCYAPTKRIEKEAFSLAFLKDGHYMLREIDFHNHMEYMQKTQIQSAMAYFREQIRNLRSPYAKRPILGHTHLYFASPVYKHADYNKWQCMPIRGNEQFCETIIRVADRYFARLNDKEKGRP